MRSQVLTILVVALVAAFAVPSGVVLAHHSSGLMDTKITTMNGTVVEYRWRNPHVILVWDTKDTSGKVVRWTGELASVTSMMADGLSKDTLKAGDEVRISCNVHKLGEPTAVIKSLAKPNGTPILKERSFGGTTYQQ
jgi:hypothetical protein